MIKLPFYVVLNQKQYVKNSAQLNAVHMLYNVPKNQKQQKN